MILDLILIWGKSCNVANRLLTLVWWSLSYRVLWESSVIKQTVCSGKLIKHANFLYFNPSAVSPQLLNGERWFKMDGTFQDVQSKKNILQQREIFCHTWGIDEGILHKPERFTSLALVKALCVSLYVNEHSWTRKNAWLFKGIICIP